MSASSPCSLLTIQLKGLVAEINEGLEELERSGGIQDAPASQALSGRLESRLRDLKQGVTKLEGMVPQELKERRTIARKKAEQLAAESFSLEKSYRKFASAAQERRDQMREREELFNMGASQGHQSELESLAMQGQSMERSSRMLDEVLESGSTILSTLGSQGRRMKGFHRKALDVANKLGISNSLLRVIERREFGDKMLVYCGMLGTLVFLFIVYRYTRGAAPPPAPA